MLGLPFADPPTKDNMATKPSQTNPIQPYGIEVKNAPAYWSQDILWTILASSEQTGGSYSLMQELCSKHSGPPPQITLAVGAEKIVAKAGSLAYIPARCVHSFRVDTQETRLLNFYLPGGFEHVITEIGVPAEARTLPPAGIKTRGTPEKMKALFKRLGMTPVTQLDSLRQS